MNWYKKTKKAMPLPRSKDIPRSQDDVRFEEDDSNNLWGSIDFMNRNLRDQSELEEKYPDLKYLGSGSYGVAYDIINDAKRNNHVLKITFDWKEIQSAKKILEMQKENGGKFPHISFVYNVSEIQQREPGNRMKMYNIVAIESEKVNRISLRENSIISRLWNFFWRNPSSLNNEREASLKNAWNYSKIALSNFSHEERDEEKISVIFSNVFNKYYDMLSSIKELGFKLIDIHSGNVGIRPETGEYVVLDFGSLV